MESQTVAASESAAKEDFYFGSPPEDLPHYDPPVPTRVTDTAGVEISVLDFANKSDRARFLDMAPPLYEGDPNYIAPLRMTMMKFLDPKKNPAFDQLTVRPIIASVGGRPVGRLTAHVDHGYNDFHGGKTGFFGFFECINDRKVAHVMLADAIDFLKVNGCQEIFGPYNFNTNHQIGLLVENFDRPPFVEETYNHRYYEELLTSFGFGKAKDLFIWWIDIENGLDSKKRRRIARVAERIRKREGVTIRHVNMKDLEGEFARIWDVYVQAWEKNWGFSPLTKKEFIWLAEDFQQVAVPELVLFVELEGKPVGFCFTLPNVNEVMPKNGRLFPFSWWKVVTALKKRKHARLITLGMLSEFRKRGLEALMFVETVIRAKNAGFTGGEIGWTLEDNHLVNRAIESMDGRLDRKFRILGIDMGKAST